MSSSIKVVSKADIGPKPEAKHVTVQMKMGGVRGSDGTSAGYSIAARTWSSGSVAKVVA